MNSNKLNHDKKDLERVVVKPLFEKDLATIKDHFTASNIKRKPNFQKQQGILSH